MARQNLHGAAGKPFAASVLPCHPLLSAVLPIKQRKQMLPLIALLQCCSFPRDRFCRGLLGPSPASPKKYGKQKTPGLADGGRQLWLGGQTLLNAAYQSRRRVPVCPLCRQMLSVRKMHCSLLSSISVSVCCWGPK